MLFVGVHIPNIPNELLSLENIDLEKDVQQLKEKISEKLHFLHEPKNLEIVYKGNTLDDDSIKLSEIIRVDKETVHCFRKTKKYEPYAPPADIKSETNIARVQELFNVIAHIQINVNSRVNILQKIVAAYPEFRRNLGAQALIRDSVLFNTLHQPEVIKQVAHSYPIICEAATFIVDTIKKELARNMETTAIYNEPATDSTNSSEDDGSSGSASADVSANSENARLSTITRNHLQAALAQIGFGSANSLSNIAQRNTDTSAVASGSGSSAPLSNSASGERISSELLRSQLESVMNNITARANASGTGTSAVQRQENPTPERMDTAEPAEQAATRPSTTGNDAPMNIQDTSEDGSGDLPYFYRTHQYADQLRTMAQMGFVNYAENLVYLNLANGSIENAISLLMGAMN